MKLTEIWTYALPTTAVAFLFGPVAMLQGIYATYFGLSLASVAMVILIARLFDAITDPIIGYCSDRYYARTGSRKPFIVAGGLLLIISSFFLYVPSSAEVSFFYFLLWSVFFYLAWTLFEIPHLAWGAELAPDSLRKNKIYSVRALCGAVGGFLFYVLPLLPLFETRDITPRTLMWSVGFGAILMVVTLCICITATPHGDPVRPANNGVNPGSKKSHFTKQLKLIISNKPFMLFLLALLFYGVGAGMGLPLLFVFIDSYLKLGDKLAQVFLMVTIFNILLLGVCYKLAHILSKKIAWCFGTIVISIGMYGSSLLVEGETGWIMLLLVMAIINGGSTMLAIMAPSILGDIIDYAKWKFDVDCGATYFSAYALIGKANIALGGALSLAIAGWYDFDPTNDLHTASQILGLRIAIAYVPAVLVLVSAVLICMNPLSRRRHAIICRRLNDNAMRTRSTKESTDVYEQSNSLFLS